MLPLIIVFDSGVCLKDYFPRPTSRSVQRTVYPAVLHAAENHIGVGAVYRMFQSKYGSSPVIARPVPASTAEAEKFRSAR